MNQIQKLLCYSGLEVQDYRDCQPEIEEENRRKMHVYLNMACGLLFAITCLSGGIGVLREHSLLYCIALVVCAGLRVVDLMFPDQNGLLLRWLMYAFAAMLYALGIAEAVHAPEELSVTFIAFLLAVPLLFMMPPIQHIANVLLFDGIFIGMVVVFESGRTVTVDIVNAVFFGVISYIISTFTMITMYQNALSRKRMREIASFDILTGMKNRNAYEREREDWASRCSVSLSCIYMDVNGLHDLNNSEGHDKGDRMLQVVALEIREMFGKNNCYRIGGDEFLAYVTDRQDPAVRKCVKDFVSIVGSAGYSVAVGVATESAGGIDVGALCRKAEKRMYLDKEEHYAGGIAVVRLSGAESYPIAARVFRPANAAKKVEDAKGYTAMYGTFREGDEAFDEGVALFFRAPHSYTGEDVVELSCHGGSAVARRLVEACLAAGAQPAARGEYTRRAFLNGKLGLTQAEAVMDLISADGRQGAALANAALGGALAKKISAQKEALTAIQAHLAAWVDFPEEDVPELDGDHLHRVLSGVKAELDELIHNYQADTVLREGVDCAIVGRPNAGKSTLLNLLAGFDRAIVTPVAGTTRDVVEQAVQLGDIQLNLFDTAGLRETEDAIEAEGIRRSWKKLEEAGLILAVFDGSEPPTREDLELAQRCTGRPAIALINKEDKPTQFDAEWIAPCFAMVLPVCCQEEESRKVISAAVARLLGTSQIDPHAASLSGQRQLSAALRARDAVAGALDAAAGGFGLDAVSVCVDDALAALCDLTGENASEAVIEQVFERFCVGK